MPTPIPHTHSITNEVWTLVSEIEAPQEAATTYCTRPSLEGLLTFDTSVKIDRKALRKRNISVAATESTNIVSLDPTFNPTQSVRVAFAGARSQVVFGPAADVTDIDIAIDMRGSDSTAVFCGFTHRFVMIRATLYGNGQQFLFGREATSNSCVIRLFGDQKQVVIGDDCMLSHDVWIQTHDMHGLFDEASGENLNPAADVVLMPHVWVGHGAVLLPGVRIGYGSVIGTRAVVTRDVPSCSVAVGVPAKVVRRGIVWDRSPEKIARRTVALLAECRSKWPDA